MKVTHGILRLSLCIPMVSAYAYDPATHADMSGQAAQVSDLNNPSKGILSDLGLAPSIQVPQQFPNSRGDNLSIAQLISSGAILEDAGRRPLNHFFDPIQNRALTVLGIALGVTSPGWALEDKGQINTNVAGTQDRSFADARTYLYAALTASGAADRRKFFGLTFQSMGQVIHHVQRETARLVSGLAS